MQSDDQPIDRYRYTANRFWSSDVPPGRFRSFSEPPLPYVPLIPANVYDDMRRTEFLPFGMDRTLDTAVVRRDGCHMRRFNTNKNDPIPLTPSRGRESWNLIDKNFQPLPATTMAFNKQERLRLLHRGGSFLNPDGSRNRHSYFGDHTTTIQIQGPAPELESQLLDSQILLPRLHSEPS